VQGQRRRDPGLAGISVTTDRTKGFTDTLKKKCPDGGIKIVASAAGRLQPDKGLTVMENILQAQKRIDAVYTHDDDMAQGVVQAIATRTATTRCSSRASAGRRTR
jgi:ABC-type sugar transport system, periplasmic component